MEALLGLDIPEWRDRGRVGSRDWTRRTRDLMGLGGGSLRCFLAIVDLGI